MKAVVFDKYGDVSQLKTAEIAMPSLDTSDVLVRVHATSVNPVDWKIRRGTLRPFMLGKLPKVLGYDVSGEVVRVGPNATGFAVGDEVFGMLDIKRDGAYAEYVACRDECLVHKPPYLSHLQAAAIPLAGLTAWQALVQKTQLEADERVLVIGASGGVGMFATQIAKAHGAHVTGVCSSRNIGFVEGLGADAALAYDRTPLTQAGVYDLIIDAAGVSSFFQMRKNLDRGGRYISTLPNLSNIISWITWPAIYFLSSGQRSFSVMTKPNQEGLRYLVRLAETGQLKVHLEKVYSLDEVAAAHIRSEAGRVVGKLVIQII